MFREPVSLLTKARYALTGAAAAAAVLERIRQVVRERVRIADRAVTFSAGVAVHTAPESWQACLARADAALYRAKREGRDRVVWTSPGEGASSRT